MHSSNFIGCALIHQPPIVMSFNTPISRMIDCYLTLAPAHYCQDHSDSGTNYIRHAQKYRVVIQLYTQCPTGPLSEYVRTGI
ncbi:hypothetical protein BJX99DRAFT_48738 [Aspergillus californicus]